MKTCPCINAIPPYAAKMVAEINPGQSIQPSVKLTALDMATMTKAAPRIYNQPSLISKFISRQHTFRALLASI